MAGRKRTVSDQEILREFLLSPEPVLTTTELMDPLDMSRQGVHSRLTQLESEGYLRSKNVGSKARVFWITDDGRQYAAEGGED